MKLSYEGIGQWAATFACTEVSEGMVVKHSANGTVAKCNDGEKFGGVVRAVSRGGDACTVVMGGLVRVPFTGGAPAVGWATLCANGQGGVRTHTSGLTCRVVDVDTAANIVTFAL